MNISLSDENGAAGTAYYDFILKNRSTTTCSLQGYPTVQVVAGTDGHQVGKNAGHRYWAYDGDATNNPHINLKPGAKAYVQLAVPNIYNYATGKVGSTPYNTTYNSSCGKAIKALGYRMYLPGENVAYYIPVKDGFPVCSNTSKPAVDISEIVPHPTSN